MKLKNLLVVVACFVATGVSAQVAIGGGEPAEGSILDLSSASNLGLLLPQVTAVPPATGSDLCKAGMMVYNTTDKRVYTYDLPNTTWIAGATQANITAAASTLVRSDNLKTVNDETIIGSGNITITGPAGAVGPAGAPGAQGPAFSTLASTSVQGLMTAADKIKLDALLSVTSGGSAFSELLTPGFDATWQSAKDYCDGLGNGWRMPSMGDAAMLAAYGPAAPQYIPYAWTSTPQTPNGYMVVHVNDYVNSTVWVTVRQPNISFTVICVR